MRSGDSTFTRQHAFDTVDRVAIAFTASPEFPRLIVIAHCSC
jgi:hypothetical protein